MSGARERACGGKIRYFTRKAAKAALKSLKVKDGPSAGKSMRVYACPFSEDFDHWHLGHGLGKARANR